MSNSVNLGTYVDINNPDPYWESYVDINDPGNYWGNAQVVPPDDVQIDPQAAPEKNEPKSPGMRSQLMGLVAEQYADRGAFAVMNRLNQSILQAGLLTRVRTIGDRALELTRYIEGMGRDGLSAQFAEVVDRIHALPDAYQHAPLEIVLNRCQEVKFLPDPDQLCWLAVMTASRPIKKVEGLSKALNSLLLEHDFASKTSFLLRFLSIAMKVGKKSGPSNGFEYSATFLRVLAILTHGKREGCSSTLANAPDNFEFLPVMVALKDMQGSPNDKLVVLSFLLMMSPRLCSKQYQVVFKTLVDLPLKEHASERELVFEAIFTRIGKVNADLREEVARSYIELISQFDSKGRERSLYLMFGYAESSWNFEELTQQFFAALSQLYPRLDYMAIRAICHAPHGTVARRTCEEFVRYIQTEPLTRQRKILTSMLNHLEIVRKHSSIRVDNFKMDYVTPIEKGLAALKS